MRAAVRDFLRERGLGGDGAPEMIAGGASFAYVFGAVLMFLLVVEAVSGAALAAFYAPSVDRCVGARWRTSRIRPQLGWLIRGLHFHARLGDRDRHRAAPGAHRDRTAPTSSRAS